MKLNKNTLLLLGASGTTFFGNGMHFIAISWIVLKLTNDPLYVSVLVLLGVIPGFISSPFAGAIADRYNKKIVTITCDISRFLIVISVPLVSYFSEITTIYLYIITVLITLFSNFFFPSFSGIIKTTVSKEQYFQVLSANNTLLQLGMIGGSGLAGIIMSSFSTDCVFYIDSLTYLVSAVLLLFIKYKPEKMKKTNKNRERISILKDIKVGFLYVFKNKAIVFLFLIGLIPNIVSNTINSLLSGYTDSHLQLNSTAYGILDAAFAVGFVAIGLTFSLTKLKKKESSLLTYGFILMSFSMILLGLSENFTFSFIGLLVTGASIALTGPSRKTLLYKQIDDEFVGRVESLNWMLFSSVSPLIALLFSLGSNSIGIENIFLIIAIVLALGFMSCKIYFSRQLLSEKDQEKTA